MQQRKYIFPNIQYLRRSFTSMTKTLPIFKHNSKYFIQKIKDSKMKNVFSLNNLGLKIMEFQNKFYLYNQNFTLWKKNNTNYMSMPEKG